MDKNFVSVDKEGIAVIKRFPVNFHEIYLENVQQSTYIYPDTRREEQNKEHDFHPVPRLSSLSSFTYERELLVIRITRIEQIYPFKYTYNHHFLSLSIDQISNVILRHSK